MGPTGRTSTILENEVPMMEMGIERLTTPHSMANAPSTLPAAVIGAQSP